MQTVASYQSDRTSLVYVMVDSTLVISVCRKDSKGEIDADRELFCREYSDGAKAAKVFVKLEQVLKACDMHKHHTTSAVLGMFADQAI